MLSTKDLVELFIEKARVNAQAGPDELIELLMPEGVDRETAECLIAFVPMAFAHVILGDLGVTLPDFFLIQDSETGGSVHGKLREEPVFAKALARARLMSSADRDDQQVAREIASRSAEWDAVAHLTRTGSAPSACVLTEAILGRLPPDYLDRRARARRSWWRGWGKPG